MVIKYLDEHGLATVITQIKNRTASVYYVKGSAIYADADYVAHAQAGDAGYEAAVDSVGVWKDFGSGYEKLTEFHEGYVYNIINEFTTDANFVEGAGKKIVDGTNIVPVNVGTEDAPVYKWDLLAASLQTDSFQTKVLVNPLTVFANGTPTVYAAAADLPATEAAATATITDGMVAIIGGDTTETGDVYRATVTAPAAGSTDNTIVWTKLGNQTTVEGSLEFLGNVAPNTPITDAEIIALFNE